MSGKLSKFSSLRIIFLALFLLISLSFLCFANDSKQKEKYQAAVNAFSDGFYDVSIPLLKRFIKDFPGSSLLIKANIYLAKSYYHLQDYRQALKILNNIQREKRFEDMLDEVCYWLAAVNLKSKDFNESFSWAKIITDVYPSSPFKTRAYYLMAESKLGLLDIEQAENILRKIVKDSDEQEVVNNSYVKLLSIYFQKKQYLQVIALGEDCPSALKTGDLSSEVYFYLAESYYFIGKWKESLSNYQKALAADSSQKLSGLIYQGIGLNYLATGNNFEAKINIDKIKDKELRLFSQGDYYFKIGDYVQSLEILNIFIRDFPKSKLIPQAYLDKGDSLYEMGRVNDSIYTYMYILNNFNDDQQIDIINKAHYGLGWGYLKDDKLEKAIDEFRNSLKNSDDLVIRVSSQIQIADAYQQMAKYDEALEIYADILNRYPNAMHGDYLQFQIGVVFLKKEDLNNAFLALRNLKSNFSSSKFIPQAQYYLAVGYFSKNDYLAAKDLLVDFVDRFSDSEFIGKAQYLYGKCFVGEKDYEQAISMFKKALLTIGDGDNQVLIYMDIANSHLNLAQFDQAKEIWNRIIKKYPNSQYLPSVMLQLGILSEKEGILAEAEKWYREIIKKYPGSLSEQEALFSLGCFYWDRGNLNQAEDYFKDLSSKEGPMAFKGKLYLARVFVEEAKDAKAMVLYNQLVELDNSVSKAASLDKAFLLKKNKDYSQAVVAFENVLDGGIDNPEVRFNLGFCLEKSGDFKQAIEEYLRSVYLDSFLGEKKLSGDDSGYQVKAYFRIAHIYEKNNDFQAAGEVYRKIIDSGVREAKIAKIRLKRIEGEQAE